MVLFNMAPIGWVWLFGFIPFHTLSIVWFVKRRRLFPIIGRIPIPTLGMMIFWTPFHLLLGYMFVTGWRPTCWLIWWIVAPVSTSFLPVMMMRATILLFRFEVTRDLRLADQARAQRNKYLADQGMDQQRSLPQSPNTNGSRGSGNGGKSHSSSGVSTEFQWRPTWWTRQRWMMRPSYLIGFVIAVITAVALVPAFTHTDLDGQYHLQCGEDATSQQFRQRVLNALIVIFSPQIGWLLIVVIRMIQRHSRESYGLVNEFLWLMIGVPMFPVAAVLVKVLHMTSSDGGSLLLLVSIVCYSTAWATSVMYPIYATYRHQAYMARRLAAVSSITKLTDLLDLPEAYESFLSFSRSELNSESVLFWRTILQFRSVATGTNIGDSITNTATAVAIATNSRGASPLVASVPRSTHTRITPMMSNTASGYSGSSPEPGTPTATATATATATSSAIPLPVITTMDQIGQSSLLATLAEANSIYAFYVRPGAPNELNLSSTLRHETRASLDSLMARAAEPPLGHLTTQLMRRHQCGVSMQLTANQSRVIEMDVRQVFNTCHDTIVELLQTNSFQRWRASDQFQQLIAAIQALHQGSRHSNGHVNNGSGNDRPPTYGVNGAPQQRSGVISSNNAPSSSYDTSANRSNKIAPEPLPFQIAPLPPPPLSVIVAAATTTPMPPVMPPSRLTPSPLRATPFANYSERSSPSTPPLRPSSSTTPKATGTATPTALNPVAISVQPPLSSSAIPVPSSSPSSSSGSSIHYAHHRGGHIPIVSDQPISATTAAVLMAAAAVAVKARTTPPQTTVDTPPSQHHTINNNQQHHHHMQTITTPSHGQRTPSATGTRPKVAPPRQRSSSPGNERVATIHPRPSALSASPSSLGSGSSNDTLPIHTPSAPTLISRLSANTMDHRYVDQVPSSSSIMYGSPIIGVPPVRLPAASSSSQPMYYRQPSLSSGSGSGNTTVTIGHYQDVKDNRTQPMSSLHPATSAITSNSSGDTGSNMMMMTDVTSQVSSNAVSPHHQSSAINSGLVTPALLAFGPATDRNDHTGRISGTTSHRASQLQSLVAASELSMLGYGSNNGNNSNGPLSGHDDRSVSGGVNSGNSAPFTQRLMGHMSVAASPSATHASALASPGRTEVSDSGISPLTSGRRLMANNGSGNDGNGGGQGGSMIFVPSARGVATTSNVLVGLSPSSHHAPSSGPSESFTA